MKGVTQDSRVLYRAMRMTIELVDKLDARNVPAGGEEAETCVVQ